MEQNNQNIIAGALTYPTRNEEPVPVQPRQPRNLQGLLRFAMEATKAEDAPGNSELGPMDEERRRFLEEALKSLTVNVVEVLQKAIKVLSDEEKIKSIQFGDPLPEDVAAAFNNVDDFVDDIDISNDFYKLGGFSIFPICFGSDNSEVRSKACHILAQLCQNNPFCQSRTMECGLFNVLLHLATSEQGHTLAMCILAISSICREYEPAGKELCTQDEACAALASALSDAHPSSRTRAALLINYMSKHHPHAREKFLKHNIVRTIIEQISLKRDQASEYLLLVLRDLLLTRHPEVIQQSLGSSVSIKRVINDHCSLPELEEDAHQEEKQYCLQILDIIKHFSDSAEETNEADR